MVLSWIGFILMTHVAGEITFGIKTTADRWDALSYLKLTLFWQNARYQCVINASYANINTIYQCDTSNTQTTYQCDTDANDVPFGLQIDENQYHSVIPSFFDEVIIHIPGESTTYNIPVTTDQIYRYTLFGPSSPTSWQYVQSMGASALCPPVSSTFGFYLDSADPNPTENPIRVTLLWEDSRHQCTLYPNQNNPSVYWKCDTSDTANTDACDASINTDSYALHLQHVSGSDGAAFARVVIKNTYRNDVQINVYEIEYFYSGSPGTVAKCLDRTIYDVIWLDEDASSCLNGYPNTLLVLNDFHLYSSRLYNAGATARCPPPTPKPTMTPPTNFPSNFPSNFPFNIPTNLPSNIPTNIPINFPSNFPFNIPTNFPSNFPTNIPINFPFNIPTNLPSNIPTKRNFPSNVPTFYPSNVPTNVQTLSPVIQVIETTKAEQSLDEDPKEVRNEISAEDVLLYAGIIIVFICSIWACACGFICKKGSQTYVINATDGGKKSINELKPSIFPPHVQLEEFEDRKLLLEWLTDRVKLPNYYGFLVANGYDSLQSLQEIKTKAELVNIGVHVLAHQTQLWIEIKELNLKSSECHIDALHVEGVGCDMTKDNVTLGADCDRGESENNQNIPGAVVYAAPFQQQSVSQVNSVNPEPSFSVRVTGETTKGRPDFYCEETIGGDDFVIQGDDLDSELSDGKTTQGMGPRCSYILKSKECDLIHNLVPLKH